MNNLISILKYSFLEHFIYYLAHSKYYLLSFPDFIIWLFPYIFKKKRSDYRTNCKENLHILFITYNARIRECKLAYAAGLCGYKVTLITHKYNLIDIDDNYFFEYHLVNNPWQCLQLIKEIKPSAIHLFVGYTNLRLMPIIKFSDVPIVYDPYDCVKGMFNTKYKQPWLEVIAEKWCFEKADHLCARSLEPLYLKRKFKYKMPPSTYFPDYCWKPLMKRDRKTIGDDEELHVVYAGGICPEDRFPKEVFGFAQYLDVGRALAKQKIHLHLYSANPIKKENYKSYYSLYYKEAENNPYFHIHEPVPHSQLMEELSKYDAGLHIFGAGINQNDGYAISRAKADYSSAAKLFDYLEIGLPVLIHDGFHQKGIIHHYGCVINISNLNNAGALLRSCLKKQKSTKTKDVFLGAHSHRLKNMYFNLIFD